MLLLLSCCIMGGIMAETTHHRVKNGSFCLRVGTPECDDIMWTLNGTVIVYNKEIRSNDTHRVDYKSSSRSMCINGLNESDAGVYAIDIMCGNKKVTETHILHVLDAVPIPSIQMSPEHSNLSAEVCNINCSIQDDWVWARCDRESCNTSQSSVRRVSISISVESTSVVCRANNNVSTNSVEKRLDLECFTNQKYNNRISDVPLEIIITAVILVAVCIIGVIPVRTFYHRRRQAAPAQLIQSQQLEEAQPRPPPRVPTSTSSDDASYENVEVPQSNRGSSHRGTVGSSQLPDVFTIYSNAGEITRGVGEITRGEEEIRNETENKAETLYSVLKPKTIKR